MNPQEKAKELFDKCYIVCQEFTEEIQCSLQAKQCALIAVDEILEILYNSEISIQELNYWKEVKHEIEKL
jgi:hypothetical protein